ncbi:hypothetical protein COB52_05175 [Candidatus Kaiserbacteria bacterium]|nr:MAG: hypothetical protein COB52_05175 [Candidatus Kaiserbacteria bacterium]
MRADYKAALKVLQLIFFLVLYIHIQACLFFYVVLIDEEWIPPVDFINLGSDFFIVGIDRQYWLSMYTSVMMFGLNEITPRTTVEMAVFSFIMLFSAMVNANIFGTMAVLI